MLDATRTPAGCRTLWTIVEQETESTHSAPSTRSSYVSAETDMPTRDGVQCLTSARNVAASLASSTTDDLLDDTTANASSASYRRSRHLTPLSTFSAWTRFRTNFIAISPTLLQHRLARHAMCTEARPWKTADASKVDAEIAAVLLKTIAVLANTAVEKLGNVNALLTKDECWLRDNIQAIVDMFGTLSRQQGYARKSKNSAKRYLYESAGRALEHLKALDDDQARVEQQTASFQT